MVEENNRITTQTAVVSLFNFVINLITKFDFNMSSKFIVRGRKCATNLIAISNLESVQRLL